MARFNIENMKEQSKTFVGIPSPAAAGIVMIPAYVTFIDLNHFLINKEILSAFLVVFSGAMMISRVPTPSLKSIKLNSLYFRIVVVSVVLILIFLITYFWQTTLAIAIAYLALAILNLFFYFFSFFSTTSR